MRRLLASLPSILDHDSVKPSLPSAVLAGPQSFCRSGAGLGAAVTRPLPRPWDIPSGSPAGTAANSAGSPAASAATARGHHGEDRQHAEPVGTQELVTRLQIFLDQQNFGPGIIDGRWGEFTGKALVHYARAHNLKVTPAIYDQLPLDTVYPIYTDYTITRQDD